jgi:rRNA small subunit pseudouridine methyltransferase Nep1
MLTLLLAECEVEPVPTEIQNHPQIRHSARARGKDAESMLLDSSLHWKAMRTLPDFERRGRPDILHTSLLVALESRLNKRGLLQTMVHTRNDIFIHINPATRLPRSYARFCGLLEDLFLKKIIEGLMWIEKKSLSHMLSEFENVCVMEENGTPYEGRREGMVVVGGFPHGGFKTPLAYPTFSLNGEPLAAWSVVSEVVVRACL